MLTKRLYDNLLHYIFGYDEVLQTFITELGEESIFFLLLPYHAPHLVSSASIFNCFLKNLHTYLAFP